MGQIVDLSVNKYASNVVEKAIQAPGSTFCELLADLFTANPKEYNFIYICISINFYMAAS